MFRHYSDQHARPAQDLGLIDVKNLLRACEFPNEVSANNCQSGRFRCQVRHLNLFALKFFTPMKRLLHAFLLLASGVLSSEIIVLYDVDTCPQLLKDLRVLTEDRMFLSVKHPRTMADLRRVCNNKNYMIRVLIVAGFDNFKKLEFVNLENVEECLVRSSEPPTAGIGLAVIDAGLRERIMFRCFCNDTHIINYLDEHLPKNVKSNDSDNEFEFKCPIL